MIDGSLLVGGLTAIAIILMVVLFSYIRYRNTRGITPSDSNDSRISFSQRPGYFDSIFGSQRLETIYGTTEANNLDGLESEFEALPKYENPPPYKQKEEESQTISLPPPQVHLSQERRDGTGDI